MPRTGERGGPQTRRRIAAIASGLFLERGFDAVTVAEVAKAAGVSSVTVFNHFPRKEDLFLDRSGDAADLLRAAVRDRPDGVDVLEALRAMTFGLVGEGHALAGVDVRSASFFKTVAESPALVARSREIAGEVQELLASELTRDSRFHGDADLFAAFFVAGYSTVLVDAARRIIDGEAAEGLVDRQRTRFEALFEALRVGVASSGETV
ncbi:MAG: TetR family transcriptional regulator [Actinobacteria bacterium HGW-Actinobacteria-5]|jgi:AcrR family transcriptional regulator|nr:MAG: TetR family transcriptional regulator [Actinobacteria bacterium HGW-Actinobacteria-5]